MVEVSFNEESEPRAATASARSIFMKLAYATGIPKNDVQAQQVLLGIGILLLIGSIAPFFFGQSKEVVAPEVMDAVMPERVR